MFLLPKSMEASRPGRPPTWIGSWVLVRRPRSYWTVVVYHLPLAVLSGMALFLPYAVTIDRLPLIPCTFLHLTGWPCPLCGFTRSFWAIANGQLGGALVNCPLALGVYLCAVLLFLWNAATLASGVVLLRGPMLRCPPARHRKITGVVLLLFLLNWGYRLAAGLK
jgi:hypothetical protein